MKYDVVSADSHVYEPPELWTRYIEPAYRSRAPHFIRQDGADLFVIEGFPPKAIGVQASAGMQSSELRRDGRHDEGRRGGWDPDARVKDMDTDGVSAEVLYPTLALGLYRIKDLGYQMACMRAYNDWLADHCAAHPDRIIGIGLVALTDIEAGIAELHRIRKKGLRGAAITAMPRVDQPFNDPRYDPFWAAAQATDTPVSLHIFSEDREGMQSGDFIVRYSFAPARVQEGIATFISFGVLERFPRLRLVSVENDIGWAGTYLARLDHAFERHRYWTGSGTRLAMQPSAYFRRQVYLTFMDDKPGIESRAHIGVDNLMWASDYPHPDSTWPHSQQVIERQMAGVPAAERRKIVAENACRLYRLT